MKRTAIILMMLTILSKILGFVRDIILSYFYGASNITDIYLVSLTISNVIFAFIGIALITGYIPIYSNIEKNYGRKQGNRYTNNLLNMLIIICTFVVIIGFIFTSQIVKMFASGFQGENLILAIKFTRITLLSIYFTGAIYIFRGFLQIRDNYTIVAIASILLNFFVILSIFVSFNTNIIVLPIGTVVGTATQLILLVPFVYKKGYKYKFVLDIKDEHIRKLVYLAIPVIIGGSVDQINVLVDRTIASQIVIGGISALTYANKLIQFVQGIFVLSIVTVLYPTISKMAAEGNINGLKESVSESISSINLLVIPATIGSMIFANPVVSLLFGRGAFDTTAISLTSYALFFYSIGMIGFGLREVLSRAFYSMQDTKTPMINAAIGMGLNIILNVILSKYMGIGGLALATSISAIFTTILMFISLRKKMGPFGMKQISISFLKILFASLVMGSIAKLSFNYLTANIFSQNLSLIVSIGVGALTYFVVIYFMKIDYVDAIVNAIKKKLTRNKVVT